MMAQLMHGGEPLVQTIDFSSACDICGGEACHCSLPEGVTIDGRTYADAAGFSVRWAGNPIALACPCFLGGGCET